MSTKFWNKITEASLGNIHEFEREIQAEEEKDSNSERALTFNYLANKEIKDEFDALSSQLDTVPNYNANMVLPSDDPPIVKFKEELKMDLDVLNNQVMEEYNVMKEFFSSDFRNLLKDKKRTEEEEIKHESDQVSDVALIKDKLKVGSRKNEIYFDRLFQKRRDNKLKQRVWVAFRNYTRNKKFGNYNVRKTQQKGRQQFLKRVLDAWRIQTHGTYKQKQIELEPTYYQNRKAEVIDEWDNLIANLRGYVDQLQMEIKIEVTAKAELIKIYEAAMNGSVQRYNKENEFVTTQINQYRQSVNFDNTFGRDTGRAPVANETDIGRITLMEVQDPEEESKQ